MKSFSRNRYRATWLAGAAVLSGCAGSLTSAYGPSSARPSHAAPRHAIAPNFNDRAKLSGDLLYTSSSNGNVYVYSYPQGKRVQDLTGFTGGLGLCSSASGDVFIPSITDRSTGESTIYEYAHGGKKRLEALSDPATAYGCSIDRITGNLAAANRDDPSHPYGSIAIYASAQGRPTLYYSKHLYVGLCSYDNKGNLYLWVYNDQANGFELARLDEAKRAFRAIKLSVTIFDDGGRFQPVVQWDGAHMTISSNKAYGAPVKVYRLQIAGDEATVVGTTTLENKQNIHVGQSWIEGKSIIGIAAVRGADNVAFWAYPKGGAPTNQIDVIERSLGDLNGIVVSTVIARPAPRPRSPRKASPSG
ncbi:MAG TPA: hypothetical protein VKR56_15995 [Candidatus Cybelea sp.]|jgi:hypothetical protein|nr:hypothetical protein [Candidatus Cybelea sp.]